MAYLKKIRKYLYNNKLFELIVFQKEEAKAPSF